MNRSYLTSLKLVALTAAGLLIGSSAVRAQAPSPAGDWDIASSGKEMGLVVLTFVQDNASGGTLTGYKIVRPVPRKTSSPEGDPRHPAGEGDRSGTASGGSTPPKPSTNFLGSAGIDGRWGFDSAGKLIGFLNQVSEHEIKPVEVLSTNVVDGFIIITTNIILKGVTTTNAVSFRGTVVPGSHITLYTYGPNGNNTLRGKPRTDLGNLGGEFYAIGKRSSVNFVDFLSLAQDSVTATLYGVDGMGAGYSFSGTALVSNQKKIAVLTLSLDGGAVLSVYTGSFSLTSRKGKLSGEDSNDKKVTYSLSPLP